MHAAAQIQGLPEADRIVIGEAIRRETEVRDAAFLAAPFRICGVEIAPLTGRAFIALEGLESPFLCGGRPTPADVAIFLWVLSPKFVPHNSFSRRRFFRACRKIEFEQAVTEISKLVEDAFQDAPGSGGAQSPARYTSWLADLVDILASEYGWSEDSILDLPLARAFQYLRRIRVRCDPKAIMFNGKSDRAIQAAVLKLRAN